MRANLTSSSRGCIAAVAIQFFWIASSAFSLLAMTDITHAADAKKGIPISSNKDAPIEINADQLEVFQEENRAVFSGRVVAIQDKTRLKADRMNVFYRQSEEGQKKETEQGAIDKIEVEGSVFLSTPEETARGDKGIYDVKGQQIRLNSNVVLTRGKNTLTGDALTYDFVTGKSKIIGGTKTTVGGKERVRALFVPEKEGGKK
jgi:lipopolysaccharide export system protein LptA